MIDILGACAEIPTVGLDGDFIDADIMARCSGPVPVDTLLAMQLHKDMAQLTIVLGRIAELLEREPVSVPTVWAEEAMPEDSDMTVSGTGSGETWTELTS